VTYLYTGVEQSCIVPNGVSAVKVIAVGGRGGNVSEPCAQGNNCPFSNFGGQGGSGARVVAPYVAVHPGETLYIEVGGNGEDTYYNPQLGGTFDSQLGYTAGAGGWNGGGAGQLPSSVVGSGGGGGASDVQTVSCAVLCDPSQGLGLGVLVSLASRLVVAGGGGGGASGWAGQGGNGGDAGWEGSTGGDATNCCGIYGLGGGGGYSNTGGAGGSDSGLLYCRDGGDGHLGGGGYGGNDTDRRYVNGQFILGAAGGGGGGGYAGGGGGGGGCSSQGPDSGGGGGGGGSSYGPPGTTASATSQRPYIQIIPLSLGGLSQQVILQG
jgi:hypothetical protein